MKPRKLSAWLAILAAARYAVNIPMSKLLLQHVQPTMMAAFLYLGGRLLLGFVAYGLSINFYIREQKDLVAAKTSAYYSMAPFLGVAFGMLILGERPGPQFYIGLAVMIAATVLMIHDTIDLQHTHAYRENETAHGHNHVDLEDHNHFHP